jgi:hypothetical protein
MQGDYFMATVKVRVGDMDTVLGEVHAVRGDLVIVPAEPKYELPLQRLLRTTYRPQPGTPEEFVAGMPKRLSWYVWAELIES